MTCEARSAKVPRMSDAQQSPQPHQSRHPVRAVEHEVEHLHEVVDKGESGATPAIMAGSVLMLVVPLAALVIGVALTVAYFVTRGGGGSSSSETAPAFTADELAAPPTDNWITNGGSLSNQRYSPLDQITTANVSQLRGVWHVHLRGSGLAAKYSAEAQPRSRAQRTCRA
jgi:hypothetical protein